MNPALTIVVPLYNSEATVEKLIRELSNLTVEGGCELVLVDDGSRDRTVEVCEKAAAGSSNPITLVRLSRNFGEHGAVMAGLHHANGAHVVTMDDDLQNPPSEVLRLLEHARTHGHEVVYSWYPKKHHSRWRNFGSWLTNRVADLLLDKPPGLYLSSFRCMSAFVVREIRRYEGPFAYVDGLILQVTQNLGTVQVRHDSRHHGTSGYTLRKLVRLWTNMFVNFSILPLHIATLLGLIMAGSGFIFTLIVFIEHATQQTPPGWGSLMAALLVFSGTQLLMLGMAGEYIGRIFLTSNKRPQFVIRHVHHNGASQPPSSPVPDGARTS